MDREAGDDNRNIPEQTESIILRLSCLHVSSVGVGHVLFWNERTIKGVIMTTVAFQGSGNYFVPHPGWNPILWSGSLYVVESVVSHCCTSPQCSTRKEFQL